MLLEFVPQMSFWQLISLTKFSTCWVRLLLVYSFTILMNNLGTPDEAVIKKIGSEKASSFEDV